MHINVRNIADPPGPIVLNMVQSAEMPYFGVIHTDRGKYEYSYDSAFRIIGLIVQDQLASDLMIYNLAM